jgi:hypothetical protein
MTVLLLLVAYAGLAGIMPAAGRPWPALPLCLIALVAIGGLWLRALAGPDSPDDVRIPFARMALAALAGLVTLPLVALALHAAGMPVRPMPLVTGGAVTATLLGAVAVLRESLSRRSPVPVAGALGLPVQRTPVSKVPTGVVPLGVVVSPQARRGHSGPSRLGTATAMAVPAALAIGIGGFAVRAYLTAPHPAEPGYLTVALAGWATKIEHPVAVPPRGLTVPVRVTSSGLDPVRTVLRLRVGERVLRAIPVTVAADTAQQMTVRVPALPADGCLRAVTISVGRMSAGFYAHAAAGGRTAC